MKEILHVTLEYKKGVGGLKSVTNGLLPCLANKKEFNISVVTPYYKFFGVLANATRIASIKHIHQQQIYTSDVYLCRDQTENGVVNHYLITPEQDSEVGMIFDIYDEKSVYRAYEHSEPLYRLSYFTSAVASLVRLKYDQIPQFDIVHTHTWHTSLAGCLIKEFEWLSLAKVLISTTSDYSLNKTPHIVNTIHMLSNTEHGLLLEHDLQLLFRSVGLPRGFELKFKDFSAHIHPKATKQIVLGLLYCDQVTIVSKELARSALSGGGIDDILKLLKSENRFLGIDNGIHFQSWDATNHKLLKEYAISLDNPLKGKLALKRKLAKIFTTLAADKKWFLYVGRFSEEKGIDMFHSILEAVQKIDANFIIMGVHTVANDLDKSPIKDYIDQFKKQKNAFVIDNVAIQEEYGLQIRVASDFTIVPSHVEAFGLVPREAMACGSIPITSDVQGLVGCVSPFDGNNNGTGFVYSDDIDTRNEDIQEIIHIANNIYDALSDLGQINTLLTRILRASKKFDWNLAPVDGYIAMYNKVLSEPVLERYYEPKPVRAILKPSKELITFLNHWGFDSIDFNKTNSDGYTPLTLSIEKNNFDVFEKLLFSGANPLLIDLRRNTPSSLSSKCGNKKFNETLSAMIEEFTVTKITEEINHIIVINKLPYKVDEVIKTGSCSLSVLVLTCHSNKQQFVLKVNTKFGRFEMRNNISLGAFIDIFNIEEFVPKNGEIRKNVEGVLQPLVPGKSLNQYFDEHKKNQHEIDKVISRTIESLHKLHVDRDCVHRDALPGNALYDSLTDRVTFIDFETLRMRSDEGVDFEVELINDFRRLLLGDGKGTKGLNDFTGNISQIITNLESLDLRHLCRTILNIPDPPKVVTRASHDHTPMRVLHVALEYGPAVLGGLGVVATQMVKAQNSLLDYKQNKLYAAIITPYYPKLYSTINFTRVASIEHLYCNKPAISNILLSSSDNHYVVEPTGDNLKLFDISTIYGIYGNENADLISKLLYFSSAVATYISLSSKLGSHPKPLIIQLHDWTVALIPTLLKTVHKFDQVKSMFVIHIDNSDNGTCEHSSLQGVGLDFKPGNHILKAIGVKTSDVIVTVSRSFLHECLSIVTQDPSAEIIRKLLVLAKARNKIVAIDNGIDYQTYNPIGVLIRDKSNIFVEKQRIKNELAARLNGSRSMWKINPNLPLILYIGRYSPEKGIDTFEQLIGAIEGKAIFLSFGRGCNSEILKVIGKYSRHVNNIYITFSQEEQASYLWLARAAAEFVYIPSHREASSLVIKESLANGCIVITSGVGGLKDSASKFDASDPDNTKGNSFIYEDYNEASLKEEVGGALLTWSYLSHAQRSKVHLRLIDEAKKHDWAAPDGVLNEYNNVYESTVRKQVLQLI